MEKRIKIEDPKDLREGMRVEVNYEGFKIKGELWRGKACPESKMLFVRDNIVINKYGDFHPAIKSIHRLIDGIEDVVVGDVLKDESGCVSKACVVIDDYIGYPAFMSELSELNYSDLAFSSIESFKEGCIEIVVSEVKQLIENEPQKPVATTQILYEARLNKLQELATFLSKGGDPRCIVIVGQDV